MAFQILNQPSFGGQAGSALGEGLTALANMKMQEYAQKKELAKTTAGLTPIFGSQLAQQLAPLGSDTINTLLKAYIERGGPMGGQQAQQPGMPQLPGMQDANQQSIMPGMNDQDILKTLQQPGAMGPGGLEALKTMGNNMTQPQQQQQGNGLWDVLSRPKPETPEMKLQRELAKNAAKQRERLFGRKETAQKEEKAEANKLAKAKVINPILTQVQTQLGNSKKAAELSRDMLLEGQKLHKSGKWPGTLVRNLPENVRDILVDDKHFRKLGSLASQLVSAKASSGKGIPSQARIKLEAMAKAGPHLDWESFKELLLKNIEDYKEEQKRVNFVKSLKNLDNGGYPEDLPILLAEYDANNAFSSAEGVPNA